MSSPSYQKKQPSSRTANRNVAFRSGRMVGKIVRSVRGVSRRGLQQMAMARQSVASVAARAWSSKTGRKAIATGLLTGMMLVPTARARQSGQEIYKDRASVNTGTNEGKVDLLVGQLRKNRYTREEALELVVDYMVNNTHANVYDEISEIIPKRVLKEWDFFRSMDANVSILQRNLNTTEIERIHDILEREVQSNPQMRKLVAEVETVMGQRDEARSQRNVAVYSILAGALLFFASRRRKRQ